MPFNQTKAIPEPEWNQHKDEIARIFLTGSMAILRAEMEEKHGFLAT
jgi:Clr5 domain